MDVRTETRLAGQVMRYHTYPTLQRQTNGEHTWQVLRIYDEMFGLWDREVARWIVWHDAAELRTGDIPYSAKQRHPALKAAADEAEEAASVALGIDWPQITPIQRQRVKFCDVLEMYEFGLMEVRLGSQLGRAIVLDTAADLQRRLTEMQEADRVSWQSYRRAHSLPLLDEVRT